MSSSTIWLILAALIISCEIFTTTFYLLAIGIAFIIAAAAASLNLSLGIQFGLCGFVALIAVLGVRQWKIKHPRTVIPADADDIGQRVHIEAWKDPQHARVKYRGSYWDAILAPNAQQNDNEYWFISARHGAILEISPQATQ